MERKTLRDGTTVDLRSPEEVTTRGRRGIQAISLGLKDVLNRPDLNPQTDITELDLTEEQADAMLRLQEAVVVAIIAGWSRPEPVPTLTTIGDLPSGLYDELAALTAGIGAELALDTSPSLEPDPKDPSGPSEPSDGPSKESAEPLTA